MIKDDGRMIELIRARGDRVLDAPTLSRPGERADWWHVAWERLSDLAYLQSIDPTQRRADWLRREVDRLCRLDPDAWIGPGFRPRRTPSLGTLETAHLGLAVGTVLWLCPDLVDPDSVRDALVERCLEPCERALIDRESGARKLNNWYHVLLDGYGMLATLLADRERTATLPERMERAAALSEVDSYGESVQYWGYAALHLTHLAEVLRGHGVTPPASVLDSLARCLPWVAQSIMFAGVPSRWGPGRYLTMVNFGDSAITARPPADVLLHLARFADGAAAGLARWIFELGYADLELQPTDLSTFGFFSQPGWRSAVHLPAAAPPIGPEEFGLRTVQSFSCGTVVARDRTRSTTVLAVQGGHGELRVDSHRHGDQGSFVLGHRGESIFADPGHCCYREPAYPAATAGSAHSTWTFRTGDGAVIEQRPDGGVTGTLDHEGPAGGPDDFVMITTEVAAAYGPPILRARRTWLFRPPHLVFLIDDVEAAEPVEPDSRFVIDDRDGRLTINQPTGPRTVLRRGGAAAKFFLLDARTDDQPTATELRQEGSVLHDVYDPHPDAPGQGRPGSGRDLIFTGPPGRTHRAVYSIVLDAEPMIRSWHVSWTEDGVLLGHPDGRDELLDLTSMITDRP